MVAGTACNQAPGYPALRAIQPSRAASSGAQLVTIHGEHFHPVARANFDDQRRTLWDFGFTARLGTYPLVQLRYVSTTALEAEVPPGLPSTTYDLVVADPRGREGTLADAFTVLGTTDLRAEDARPRDGGLDRVGDRGPRVDRGQPQDRGCPAACNAGCPGGVCKISGCSVGNCTCPPGMACEFVCSGQGDCPGIECGEAKSCVISCGARSCDGPITCGKGACIIVCSGQSCLQPINCQTACACSLVCDSSSCAGNVHCPASCSTSSPVGCTLMPAAVCDTCS